MKKLFRWLMYVALYVMGVSCFIIVTIMINQMIFQSIGKIAWWIHAIETILLLLMGWGLAYFINRFYQHETPDSLFKNWQIRPALFALGYVVLLLASTITYDALRKLFGLPEAIPENQRILMHVMTQIPFQLTLEAAILAPIIEEVLFRGTLYRVATEKLRQPLYFVPLSACLFALLHAWPNSLDFVIYAVMGAILAQCYLHTRQLKYSILSHIINNGIVLLLMWQAVN